ncbi:hypothetical protein ABEB36_009019 [Hypothenemus hampei]|uniref:Factor VIII intron 22 protein n=1 Tax=Hypothenemus hampei TaxID=57062 RepID=A0ABD1ENU6_HYPHA
MSNESTTGYTILDQYRNITGKLKKRFLRKPNETEALEAFTNLSLQCESQDLPQYAALTWTARARCEGTLGNTVNESSCLLRAARHFLRAAHENIEIGCISIPTEYLQAGLACYSHVSTRCSQDSSIPQGLNLEIVNYMQEIGQLEAVKAYLDNAVEQSQNQPDSQVYCLNLLAAHFITIGDYVSALQIYEKIKELLIDLPINGYRCELLLESEVNSVFLLLILRPNPQNILAKVLEKYTWGGQNDPIVLACRMSDELFILMQSIVTICQSLDPSSLNHIESEFWPFLSILQKDLLRTLVKIYCL